MEKAMARIGKVEREGATGEAERLFVAAETLLGRAPNFYRYLANSPLVAKMLLPFNAVMQRQGGGSVLPAKIKEMVVIKTSAVNGCAYCYAHNTSLGMAAGITGEQVQAIDSDDYLTSPLLSPRERAAVQWAEHVTRNTARERDDVFEELKAHFNDAEIVELTLISGMFNMFNRFMDSLQVPLEPQDEIDKIKRSLNLDPENVRAYFSTVLDNWPEDFPRPVADAAE
jgi:uncharacterized peroxidase-related enzyme